MMADLAQVLVMAALVSGASVAGAIIATYVVIRWGDRVALCFVVAIALAMVAAGAFGAPA